MTEKLWTRKFILMCIANLLMSLAFYFLIPTLPLFITNVLHGTKLQVGIIFASYTVAALLIRPFTGFAVDSFGRKTIFLISFLAFTLLLGSYALVFTALQLLILRFLHGLSWGSSTTSFSTLVVDIIPSKRRGEGLGFFGLFMTGGMALGPMIGNYIAENDHYQRMFIVAALLSFTGLILAACIKYPSFEAHPANKNFRWNKLIEPTSLPVSLIILMVCFSYGSIVVFSSIYAEEIGIKKAGVFFAIYAIGLAISRFFAGKIFDRRGPHKITFYGLASLFIGLVILSLVKNNYGYLLSAFIIGIGFGIVFPTFQAMVNHIVPLQKIGAANSTFFTSVDLGIGLGAVITGILAELISLTYTFLVWALIILLAMLIFYSYSVKEYDKELLLKKKQQ
ncbi:MAG: MFS transporter [Bacteroidetes bacterium]|nr:MFS transporter [Bacteroidota bacterium]